MATILSRPQWVKGLWSKLLCISKIVFIIESISNTVFLYFQVSWIVNTGALESNGKIGNQMFLNFQFSLKEFFRYYTFMLINSAAVDACLSSGAPTTTTNMD